MRVISTEYDCVTCYYWSREFFGDWFYHLTSYFHFLPWFSYPNRTVWSDLVNHESLTIAVLLTLRTSIWEKSMELLKPWSNHARAHTHTHNKKMTKKRKHKFRSSWTKLKFGCHLKLFSSRLVFLELLELIWR